MDIYEYIDNYGIYSFDEKELNEVDVVIFTYLSYVNYMNVLEKGKVTINKAARTHQGLHNKNEKNLIAIHDAAKLLYYIKDLKRYKDCLLYNYIYEEDDDIQFGAVTIEYQKNKIFISYEGTNERISGWKENLILSYNFPTRSHIKALDYINHHYTFSNKKIIVGGHSKGGNFALVAGMCANPLVRARIEHVYNVDGPGLLSKQFNSKKFQRIVSKYTHIIPDDSIIGILLYSTNYKIVKTDVTGPLAHHILYWKTDGDHFKNEELSSFSRELKSKILEFVETTRDDELENVVNNFASICEIAGIKSLLEVKYDHKRIIDLITASKYLDSNSRKSLYNLVNLIVKAFGDSKYNDFKEFVNKFRIEN